MFLVQGVGDICGAANCDFWVLDTKHHILLEKVTQTYSILPQIHNGRPDIFTSMHGSATDSSLSYWQFQGRRYVRIHCAELSYGDADGNIFNKPKSPHTHAAQAADSPAMRVTSHQLLAGPLKAVSCRNLCASIAQPSRPPRSVFLDYTPNQQPTIS